MTLQVTPLDPALTHRGADPRLLKAEYLEVVTGHIDNHPRSQQVQIGPSEIGSSCARRIAHKLLSTPESNSQPAAWLPTIGTAVHAWLEDAFDQDNVQRAPHLAGQERWLVETRLTVGFVPGLGFIEGSCDLYDRVTCAVVDHKIVGPSTLRKYKASGPSTQYRVQAHLYGQGWALAGHTVDTVAIMFLPRNAPLDQAYFWSEPWQPEIAQAALQRLGQIQQVIAEHGPRAPELLNTHDEFCSHCPFFRTGTTDLTSTCPGVPGAVNTSSQLDGLIDSAA